MSDFKLCTVIWDFAQSVMRSGATAPPGPTLISVSVLCLASFVFFFQAEDGIRDDLVTGVQTCALPISFEEGANSKIRKVSSDQKISPLETRQPKLPVWLSLCASARYDSRRRSSRARDRKSVV